VAVSSVVGTLGLLASTVRDEFSDPRMDEICARPPDATSGLAHTVKHLCVMTELTKQGRDDRMTGDPFKLTGQKPTSMYDSVKPHAAAFTREHRSSSAHRMVTWTFRRPGKDEAHCSSVA
jgi:hypothetical protein